MAYFFPSGGRGADSQVHEKESHLEQKGVMSYPVTSQVPLSLPQLLSRGYVYATSIARAIRMDVSVSLCRI